MERVNPLSSVLFLLFNSLWYDCTMNITFGVITDGKNDERLVRVCASIEALKIESYEVIVVGNSRIRARNAKVVPFVESPHGAWITKKKNLITRLAAYPNIVYLHDYFIFDTKWYEVFSTTRNFDVAMCEIVSPENTRYRDWTLWPHNGTLIDLLLAGKHCLIPYSCDYLKEFMYISGSFWIAKRDFMLKNPLDESLFAGDGEDVEWSLRIRENARIVMVQGATINSLKNNNVVMREIGGLLRLILGMARFKQIKRLYKLEVSARWSKKLEKSYNWYRRHFSSP